MTFGPMTIGPSLHFRKCTMLIKSRMAKNVSNDENAERKNIFGVRS